MLRKASQYVKDGFKDSQKLDYDSARDKAEAKYKEMDPRERKQYKKKHAEDASPILQAWDTLGHLPAIAAKLLPAGSRDRDLRDEMRVLAFKVFYAVAQTNVSFFSVLQGEIQAKEEEEGSESGEEEGSERGEEEDEGSESGEEEEEGSESGGEEEEGSESGEEEGSESV